MEGPSKRDALTKELKEWLGQESIRWPQLIPLPESKITRWARVEIPFGKHPEAKVFSDKGDFEEVSKNEELIPNKESQCGKDWKIRDNCLYSNGEKLADLGSDYKLHQDIAHDLCAFFSIPGFGKIVIKEHYTNCFKIWLIRDGVISKDCDLLCPNMDLDYNNSPTIHIKKDFTLVVRSSVWSNEHQDIEDLNKNFPDLHLELNEPEINAELSLALNAWIGSITWPAQIPLQESLKTRQARLEVPFAKNPVATLHSTFADFEEVNPLQGKAKLNHGQELYVYGDYVVSPHLIVDLKQKKVVASNRERGGTVLIGFLRIPEFGTVFIKYCYNNEYKCFLFKDGASSERVMLNIPGSFRLNFGGEPKLSFRRDFTIVVQTEVQAPEEYNTNEESCMDYWNR